MLASHAALAAKVDSLERQHDAQFKVVFDATGNSRPRPTPSPGGFPHCSAKPQARQGAAPTLPREEG